MNIHVLASGSDGNAYLIQGGNSNLLIEAGIPFKKLQEKLWAHGVKVSDLDGCLISHSHQDHCKAVKQLIRNGVTCYMNDDTEDELRLRTNSDGFGKSHHRVHILTPITVYSHYCGDWVIKPFDAVHDVPCLGFIISHSSERLLYLSDSAYSPYTFPGLTHIIIGCNYSLDILNRNIEAGKVDKAAKHRLIHSHASLETVKDLLRANNPGKLKEVYLCHISSRNGDPERFKREVQEIVGCPVYVG